VTFPWWNRKSHHFGTSCFSANSLRLRSLPFNTLRSDSLTLC